MTKYATLIIEPKEGEIFNEGYLQDVKKFYKSIAAFHKTIPLPDSITQAIEKNPKVSFGGAAYIVDAKMSDVRYEVLIDALRKKFDVQVFVPI